jgi:hypothetical protein
VRQVIRALALTLGAFALTAACASAPVVKHTEYRYSLPGPTGDFHPGQKLPLTWTATAEVVTGSPPLTSGRVCVALVGPYGSVEELKTSTPSTGTCPIAVPRTIVASDLADADPAIGRPIDQSLMLPASLAPGFYSLISVFAYGSGTQGGAMSSAGIVRVTAP